MGPLFPFQTIATRNAHIHKLRSGLGGQLAPLLMVQLQICFLCLITQLLDLAQKLPEKKQVISSQSLPAFKKHNLNKMCFCAVIKGFCVQVKLLIPFKKDWRDSHAPLFDSTISCAFLPLCRFMGRKFCPSLHFMPRWLCQNVVRKQDSRPRSERVIMSTVFKRK